MLRICEIKARFPHSENCPAPLPETAYLIYSIILQGLLASTPSLPLISTINLSGTMNRMQNETKNILIIFSFLFFFFSFLALFWLMNNSIEFFLLNFFIRIFQNNYSIELSIYQKKCILNFTTGVVKLCSRKV